MGLKSFATMNERWEMSFNLQLNFPNIKGVDSLPTHVACYAPNTMENEKKNSLARQKERESKSKLL